MRTSFRRGRGRWSEGCWCRKMSEATLHSRLAVSSTGIIFCRRCPSLPWANWMGFVTNGFTRLNRLNHVTSNRQSINRASCTRQSSGSQSWVHELKIRALDLRLGERPSLLKSRLAALRICKGLLWIWKQGPPSAKLRATGLTSRALRISLERKMTGAFKATRFQSTMVQRTSIGRAWNCPKGLTWTGKRKRV